MAQQSPQQFATWLTDARKAYDAGDMPRAESLYRMVVTVDGKHVEGLRMLALLVAQRGEFEQGLTLMDRAIAAGPNLARLYFFRGNILEYMKRFDETLDAYNETIKREPDFLPVYISRGITYGNQGRYDEAVADFTTAIRLNPGQPEAYFNRANTYHQMNRLNEAVSDYEKTIHAVPHFAAAYNNLGVVLKAMGKLEDALAQYKFALRMDTNYYHAHNNMGVIYHALGYSQEALNSYNMALALEPNYAEVYNNKGITLGVLRRYEEALSCFTRAFELYANFSEACNNRAYVLQEMKRYDEALVWYEKATSLMPGYVEAHWNKATLYMLLGDYEKGLPMFEWRWKRNDLQQDKHDWKSPLWLGEEELQGKTIVLYAEQGFGDTIQYCRFVARVQALGAHVILEVQEQLTDLMATLASKPVLVETGQPLPEHDYHCPLMSLPLALGTRVETIPADVPYLFADPVRRALWREQLEATDKLRVGIAWSGNASHKNNHNRSILMPEFASLFALCDKVEFHALQQEISPEEYKTLRDNDVITHVTELNNFTDTAALIAEMDLVISVDTAVVHLAGALAKPVWALIPFAPDFRWLTDRTDSVWYPTARLFRQQETNNWPQVLAEVGKALTHYKTPRADG